MDGEHCDSGYQFIMTLFGQAYVKGWYQPQLTESLYPTDAVHSVLHYCSSSILYVAVVSHISVGSLCDCIFPVAEYIVHLFGAPEPTGHMVIYSSLCLCCLYAALIGQSLTNRVLTQWSMSRGQVDLGLNLFNLPMMVYWTAGNRNC